MTSILTFHTVTDGVWFEDVICWLKRRYRLLPIDRVSEFYARPSDCGQACHVTVDDGDRSFAEIMFPILVKHGVSASLFVSPKMCVEGKNFWFQEIGAYREGPLRSAAASALEVPEDVLRRFSVASILKAMPLWKMNDVLRVCRVSTDSPAQASQNISASALKKIAASGLVCVGAHTMNHPILSNEDDATCEYEIARSVSDLASLLQRPVRSFAYPNGIPGLDLGEREVNVLRNSGVRMAFTTESRHLSRADNQFRIPRIAISDKEAMRFVRAKILLGSNWSRLKRIAGTGEAVERGRLSRALKGFRARAAN